MALSATRLATAMRANWDAFDPVSSDLTSAQVAAINAYRQALCLAFASAQVVEIEGNAEVVVTSVTGVQTGLSSSGPGTGTIL
jgi:hypothetical protein